MLLAVTHSKIILIYGALLLWETHSAVPFSPIMLTYVPLQLAKTVSNLSYIKQQTDNKNKNKYYDVRVRSLFFTLSSWVSITLFYVYSEVAHQKIVTETKKIQTKNPLIHNKVFTLA